MSEDAGTDEALRHYVKAELRKRMLAIRASTPLEARAERSARIVANIEALADLSDAHVLAAYAPMAKEVDVSPLVRAWLARGLAIALPRVDRETGKLVLHAHTMGDALEESGFGVREPLESAPVISHEEVDVVIVPALALDERGHRIGYGKGFYDRLLPELPNALRIGVIFDFQLVPEVPTTEGDVPVDIVVTDARSIGTRTRGG